MTLLPNTSEIAVIGLGYVGLPLAAEFGKKQKVIGFDIDASRFSELQDGIDRTGEFSKEELKALRYLKYASSVSDIKHCNIFIITVPTPINDQNTPDLSPLVSASSMVGDILKPGDIVIYESTVFPGATEEVCAPILAEKSGLTYSTKTMPEGSNVFYLGYSPERINPGDKYRRLTDIVKVTSGSTPEIADFIDELYSSIITAGTHKAESIKIAEAAKVIENTQRDVNIALINELTMLFDKLDLDTEAVLKAAGTKWNFLPFRPGLVGGHCIGVDPYYLTHKAQQVGHDPKIILAGRRINDNMASYAAGKIINLMLSNNINVAASRILVLGFTFKENCPDIRNSKVIDMANALIEMKASVDFYDPYVHEKQLPKNVEANLIGQPGKGEYDCIVIAVSHQLFIEMGAAQIRMFGREKHVLFDLKYAFNVGETDGRL